VRTKKRVKQEPNSIIVLLKNINRLQNTPQAIYKLQL